MPELTPKQAAFVQHYLTDLNATQAAIRAGYSAKTAQQMGAENLSKPVIAAAISGAMKARAERIELTQDDVVRGLHREATLEGDQSSHSARVSAWGLLGKHLGMFSDKAASPVTVNLVIDRG
jgi:phage terminase small subunit